MPETLPGCRLMAGSGRRSSTETALRSLRLVTPCPLSVATTWCTTGLKAWRSVCTGTYARGRPDWRTSQTLRTRKTEPLDAFSRPLLNTFRWRFSQQLSEKWRKQTLCYISSMNTAACIMSTVFYTLSQTFARAPHYIPVHIHCSFISS